MKLNWGHYLAIAMVGFIAFIIGLITLIGNDKDALVEESYYEKGLQHEDVITREKNSLTYKDQVRVRYLGGNIEVDLPDSMEVQNVRLIFMRPDDVEKDLAYAFKSLTEDQRANGNTLFFRKSLDPGLYQSKVT